MRQSERASTDDAADGPRLDIRAPVVTGMTAFLLLMAAVAGAVAFVPVEQVVRLEGVVADSAARTEIKTAHGGQVAAVHVAEGQLVAAGDALISIDSRGIGEELASLKAQLDAANKQLEMARMEATTAADLAGRKAVSSQQLASVKGKAAEAEAEAQRLTGRIVAVQQEIERSVLRAPSSGTVDRLSLLSAQNVAAGVTLLDIAAVGSQWTIDTCDPAHQRRLLAAGAPLRAWLTEQPGETTASSGTLAVVTARREPASMCADGARIEIERDQEAGDAMRPGRAVTIEIMTGKRALIDQLAFWSGSRKTL